MGSLRGLPRTPSALCSTQSQSLLLSQPEVTESSLPGTLTLDWGAGVGLGMLAPQGILLHLDIPLDFYLPHMVWTSPFHSSTPLTSLDVASTLYP